MQQSQQIAANNPMYQVQPGGQHQQPVSTNQRHSSAPYFHQRQNPRPGQMQATATSRAMSMNTATNMSSSGVPANHSVLYPQIPHQPLMHYPAGGNPSAHPGMNNYNRTWAPSAQAQYSLINHNQWTGNSFQQYPHQPQAQSVYYPATVVMSPQQPLQGQATNQVVHQPQPPQPNPTPAPESKRGSKAIQIINPITGIALNVESLKGSASGTRNTATPPHSQLKAASAMSNSSETLSNSSNRSDSSSSEIAAQFATLVAAAAVSDKAPTHSTASSISQNSSKDSDKLVPDDIQKEVIPEKQPVSPTSASVENAPAITGTTVPVEADPSLVDEAASIDTTERLSPTPIEESAPTTAKDNVPTTAVEIVPQTAKESVLSDSMENISAVEPEKDNSDSVVPNGEIPSKQECHTPMTNSSPEDTSESAANKKKKGKQRLKNLNDKGKEKEGGEMDAFLDSSDKEVTKESISNQNVGEVETNLIIQPQPEQPCSTENTVEQISEASIILNGPTSDECRPDPIEDSISVRRETDVNSAEEKSHEPIAEVELPKESVSEVNVEDAPEENVEDVEETEPSEAPEEAQPAVHVKYDYKPDQWSPLNPDGKKQYDRNFLLQLQDDALSQVKPQGLPNLEVIRDEPAANSPKGSFDFTPGYVGATNSNNRSKSQSMQRKTSQQGKNNSMRRININVEVQLHQSENAWKPSALRKSDSSDEGTKIAKVVAKARTILNKLTPSNFRTLAEHFSSLPIDTEEKMSRVMDLLFLKALDEPKFVLEYAQLCKSLNTNKAKIITKTGQELGFQYMILHRCQVMFEQDPLSNLDKETKLKEIEDEKDPNLKAMLKENLDSDIAKAKRQMVGNIRFIAELYKLKILTFKIIFECYEKLLNSSSEMAIECLCTLIKHVGKDMELDSKEAGKGKLHPQKLEDFYKHVAGLAKAETDNRTKFMLRDVVELKKNNWVPRRADTGPLTIQEVHKQAAKEQYEMQQQLQNTQNSGGKRSDDRHMRRKGGYSSSQNANEDGWSLVSSKARHATFDPVILKSIQQPIQADENIQLGPGGPGSFKMWGSGSNGGNRPSADSSNTRTPSNRFNALQSGNDFEERSNFVVPRSGPPSRDSSVNRQKSNTNSGRRTSQPQRGTSKERQDLLNSVSNLTKSDNSRKDRKGDGEEKVLDPLSEEFKKRCRNIADENIQIGLKKEVLQDLKSILNHKTAKYYATETLLHTFDRNDTARSRTAQIFKVLFEKSMITSRDFADGLIGLLSIANDLLVDIPKFWPYFSQLVAPIFRYPSSFEVIKYCVHSEEVPDAIADKLVSVAVNAAVSEIGEPKVAQMWQSLDMRLPDLIRDKKLNLEKYVQKEKFQFLFEEHPNVFDPAFVRDELNRLLCVVEVPNNDILAFIERFVGMENVQNPQFIRALIVEVLKSGMSGEGSKSVFDRDICAKRVSVCQKFIASKAELELEALYGVQRMLYNMDFPLGAVRLCFDFLYDEEIISEEAFFQWEKDPREKDGHAVLMKSLTSFFIWLKEADNDNSVAAVLTIQNSAVDTSSNRIKMPSAIL